MLIRLTKSAAEAMEYGQLIDTRAIYIADFDLYLVLDERFTLERVNDETFVIGRKTHQNKHKPIFNE